MEPNETATAALLHFRGGRTMRSTLMSSLDHATESIDVTTEDGPQTVRLDELKAIFFLRERAGMLDEATPQGWSLLSVEFADGEVIRGRSGGYSPGHTGFFLYPLDRSKNDRIFVISSAVVSIDVEKL